MSETLIALRRDRTIIGVVGLAHYLSHFYQLALPPLFILIREDLGVSFTQLGAVMFTLFLISGICQAIAGVLVDKFGARRLLLAGLGLFALSTGLMGLVSSYWMMLPLAVLAGAGNSVFHPADLAILSHNVETRRVGRGFSFHGFAGLLGYASSPVLMATLALATNWRIALIIVSLAGLAAVFMVAQLRDILDTPVHSDSPTAHVPVPGSNFLALMRTPAIVMGFFYFLLIAMSGNGIQTFSIPAFMDIFHIELDTASRTLTSYLLGAATGILIGGVLADRSNRHDIIAMFGVGIGGFLIITLATAGMSYYFSTILFTLAGVSVGVTQPSRDMLIRSVAPRGVTGKVFGLVYSGLDAGSSLSPLLFGWMMDHGKPRLMLIIIGALLIVTIATVFQFRRKSSGQSSGVR